jgi:hypothetical protein
VRAEDLGASGASRLSAMQSRLCLERLSGATAASMLVVMALGLADVAEAV